jgi:hypothetical protein
MKQRRPSLPYRLVMVEWEDSARPTSEWQWADECEVPVPIECVSVGYLIAKTEGGLAIAANLGDVRRDRIQASGIMHIPACSVRKIVDL